MKKFNLIPITLLFLQILFTSCEEVIDIDIENVEQRIVIDGVLTNAAGSSRVLLSMSENVFRSNSNTKVNGAAVTINDSNGNSETLKESEPGKFLFSSVTGTYGKTYSINVKYDGKEYTGVSTLNEPMKIDSAGFVKATSYIIWGVQYSYYKMKIYIQNKPGIDEFCLIKIKDAQNKIVRSSIVFQDKYTDGKQIIIEDGNTQFQKGETVNIEVMTLDKPAYEYFYQLNELSEDSGIDLPDIFNIKTYSPKSNLSNGALGLFYAYSSQKYKAVVK